MGSSETVPLAKTAILGPNARVWASMWLNLLLMAIYASQPLPLMVLACSVVLVYAPLPIGKCQFSRSFSIPVLVEKSDAR